MRQLILAVVVRMLLPLYPAQAAIRTDLNSDLSLSTFIKNAVADSQAIDTILSKFLVNCKPVDELITCMADSVNSIISAAANASSSDATAQQSIDQAGQNAGFTEEFLTQIAIAPNDMLPAGNPRGQGQRTNFAPGLIGNSVNPPAVGSNASVGCSSNASPNAQ